MRIGVFTAVVLFLGFSAELHGQNLRASKDSVAWEFLHAEADGHTFFPSTEAIFLAIGNGTLISLWGDPLLEIDDDVSFPFVLPVAKKLLDYLKVDYHVCGEKLTATSGTRPYNEQPPNASPISVHPTGMAIDLRRSSKLRCQRFLENTLLTLKELGMLDFFTESNPAHYHVAVYSKFLGFLIESE